MSEQDRRIAPRRRTIKGGKIIINGTSVYDCMVRNLSDTGARLKLESTIGIPTEFEFKIVNEDIHVVALVKWRNDREMGVSFERFL